MACKQSYKRDIRRGATDWVKRLGLRSDMGRIRIFLVLGLGLR